MCENFANKKKPWQGVCRVSPRKMHKWPIGTRRDSASPVAREMQSKIGARASPTRKDRDRKQRCWRGAEKSDAFTCWWDLKTV
jgi:hypothetical protein